MKKKAIFLLLILTGIVPIACCPENPSGPYLLNLRHVSLLSESYMAKNMTSNSEYYLLPEKTYTEDTLVLSLFFDYLLAKNSINFAFQPTAIALSCDFYPNYEQLNDKIKDIIVTSDSQFNEVEAGEPLNSKVIAFNEDFKSPLSLAEAVSLINSINGNEFESRGLNTLAITQKPTGTQEHAFKVTINYESGKQEVAESFRVNWK